MIDVWKLTDEEQAAIIVALESITDRGSRYGARLHDQLVTARDARARARAEDAEWEAGR